MAINSGELYLQDKIQSIMNGFLSSPYIISEDILSEVPDSIKNPFLTTYGLYSGAQGTEIPVTFTFPEKKQQGAFILIQFKGSNEDVDNSSIGNVQANTASYQEGNELKEKATVMIDNSSGKTEYYVEVSHPIFSISNIPEISGSSKFKFSGNRIELPSLPFANNGFKVTVYYSALRTDSSGNAMKDKDVIRYGVNMIEGYTIDFCSTNQDTIKCLTVLLMASMIYLRKTLEDNDDFYLPNITLNGSDLIEEINSSTDTPYGQQLFYRRAELTYKVTQSIMSDAGDRLSDINIE